MLRVLLTVLPTLQIGARIKQSVDRGIRQAIVIAVACLFLLLAAVFGLIAGYLALQVKLGFAALEAAGIVGASLMLLGLLALGMMPLITREPKAKREVSPAQAASRAVGAAQNQVGEFIQRLGPAGVLSTAFVIGLILARRR